jgi:antitoxin VapB
MSTPLNIRDPRARELARELAGRRKTSITAAVIEALEHELAREREAIPLAVRLAKIAERANAHTGPDARTTPDAERDAMWTR